MINFSNDTVEFVSKEALKQIDNMKYDTELVKIGINNILKLAIVFKGKEIFITQNL